MGLTSFGRGCLLVLTTTGLFATGVCSATLEVETGTCYQAVVRPATYLTACVGLDCETLVVWKGEITFRDYFGKTFSVPVDAWGAKGTPIRVKLPEPPGMGLWRGTAKLVSSTGEKAECHGNFAVLDPHPVTPLVPRDSFRIGLNYHVTRYTTCSAIRRWRRSSESAPS